MLSPSMHEWARFLDVRSDDEGAMAAMAHYRRLYDAQELMRHTMSQFSYAPGGDIPETLQVAFNALSEAMELLDVLARRFRAGDAGVVHL